jgi:hypothetical protein
LNVGATRTITSIASACDTSQAETFVISRQLTGQKQQVHGRAHLAKSIGERDCFNEPHGLRRHSNRPRFQQTSNGMITLSLAALINARRMRWHLTQSRVIP